MLMVQARVQHMPLGSAFWVGKLTCSPLCEKCREASTSPNTVGTSIVVPFTPNNGSIDIYLPTCIGLTPVSKIAGGNSPLGDYPIYLRNLNTISSCHNFSPLSSVLILFDITLLLIVCALR